MESQINNIVWNILTNDEKTALTLSLGYGKSTWESGEILKKAHFKYLEIQKRASKFLEVFTNHFNKYDNIIPEEVDLPNPFKEYIHLTLVMRKNISQTVRSIEDPRYSIALSRNRLITEAMEKLKKNRSQEAIDLYGLIMDFDRWNNFRILPTDIQEPSAFKRRNKARYKKHIKNLLDIPQFSIISIINRFSYSGKYSKWYLPIVSNYLDDGYKVISIKQKGPNLKFVNDVGLFIFTEESQAIKYSKLVSRYFLNEQKDCKLGQKFWPEFRVLVEMAINFKELENIHKSRTFLDKALFDRDKQVVSNKKYHKELLEEPSEETAFY